jgi:hypothetical protein
MRTPGLFFDPLGFRPSDPDRRAGLSELARQDFELNVGMPPPQRQRMVNSGSQLSPQILFNSRSNRLYVRGREFDVRSPFEVLESVNALSGTGGAKLEGGLEADVQQRIAQGWTPLSLDDYETLIANTEDPGAGTRFGAGVSRGIAQSQEMLGRALQATGVGGLPIGRQVAETFVDWGQETQQRLSPWQVSFTRDVIENDDDRFGGLTDWAVTTLGEALPSIVESIAAVVGGAAIGSAVAGPGVGTVGGALSGFASRTAFRRALQTGIERRLRGEAVNAAQRRAIISASAMAAGLAQNYGTGVGDIYTRLMDAGVDPDNLGARFTALSGAVPYAALEFLPEFVAVNRLLGRGTTQQNLVRRVVGTAGTVGALEALTEAGQEGIGIAAETSVTGRDLNDQDLAAAINALAAGFLVGGAIGGVAGLRSPTRDPVNILTPPPPPTLRAVEIPDGPAGGPAGALSAPGSVPIGATPISPLGTGPGPVGGSIAPPPPSIEEGQRAANRPSVINLRDESQPRAIEDTGPAQAEAQLNQERQERRAQYFAQFKNLEENGNPNTAGQRIGHLISSEPALAPTIQQFYREYQAQKLLDQVDNGVTPDRLKVVNIARNLGLEAVVKEQAADTISRIRQRLAERNAPVAAAPAPPPAPPAPEPPPPPSAAPVPPAPPAAAAPTAPPAPEPPPPPSAAAPTAPPPAAAVAPEPAPAPTTAQRPIKGFKTAKGSSYIVHDDGTTTRTKAERSDYDHRGDFGEKKRSDRTIYMKENDVRWLAIPDDTNFRIYVTPASVSLIWKAGPLKPWGTNDGSRNKYYQDTPLIGLIPVELWGEDPVLPGAYKNVHYGNQITSIEQEESAPEPAPPPWQPTPVAPRQLQRDNVERPVYSTPPAAPAPEPELTPPPAPAQQEPVRAGPVTPRRTPAPAPGPTPAAPASQAQPTETIEELKKRIRSRLSELQIQLAPIRKREGETVGPNVNPNAIPTPKEMVERQLVAIRQEISNTQARLRNNPDNKTLNDNLTTYRRNEALLKEFDLKTEKGLSKQLKTDTSFAARYKEYLNDWLDDVENEAERILERRREAAGAQTTIEGRKPVADLRGVREEPPAEQETPSRWQQIQEGPQAPSDQAILPEDQARQRFAQIQGQPPISTENVFGSFDTEVVGIENTPEQESTRQPEAGDSQLKKPVVKRPRKQEFIGESGRPVTVIKPDVAKLEATKFMNRASVGAAARDGVQTFVANSPEELKARFPGIENQLDINKIEAAFYVPSTKGGGDTTSVRIAEILSREEPTRNALRQSVEARQSAPVVIVAAYNIKTAKQLRFAMAHELHGHYGLQLAFTNIKNALKKDKGAPQTYVDFMNQIYDNTPWVRNEVDARLDIYQSTYKNLPAATRKAYMIEEALADRAAVLETNIVARIWDKTKEFLGKLGVLTDDALARHWIKQARIYVRSNDPPPPGTWQEILRETDADLTNGAFRASIPYTGSPAAMAFAQPGVFGAPTRINAGNMGKIAAGLARGGKRAIAQALETIQTTDNIATRSYGLSELLKVFRNIGETSKNLLGKYEQMTGTARNAPLFGLGRGVPDEQIEIASELLAYASLYKLPTVQEEDLDRLLDFLIISDRGVVTIDPAAFEALKRQGIVTPEEFSRGFDWNFANGERAGTYQRNVKADDQAYVVYKEYMDGMFEAVKDRVLAEVAHYSKLSESGINRILARFRTPPTQAQREWFRRIREAYNSFQEENAEEADIWLRNVLRALHSTSKIDDWDRTVSDAQYARDRAAKEAAIDAELAAGAITPEQANTRRRALEDDDFIHEFKKTARYRNLKDLLSRDALEQVNQMGMNLDQQKKVLTVIQRSAAAFASVQEQQKTAKRNIAGHYVPLRREGKFQVRVRAIVPGTENSDSPQIIRLHEDFQQMLPYLLMNNSEDTATGEPGARSITNQINEVFGNRVWKVKDSENQDVNVILQASFDEAFEGRSFSERINFSEVIRLLDTLNISLSPRERANLIEKITETGSRIRASLERSATPGFDKDVIRLGADPYLESMSRISARRIYVSDIDDIMNNETGNNWFGNFEYLRDLQARFDAAADAAQRTVAEQELVQYAYMLRHMAPVGRTFTITTTKGKQRIETLGQGNRGRAHAAKLLELYAQNVDVAGDDIDTWLGKVGSGVRTFTVVMQLGGSVASGLLNLVSLPLAVAPYLAGFNYQTGRGGGFGDMKTATELGRATGNISKMAGLIDEREKMQKMVARKEWTKYGLTEAEARMLLDMSDRGQLQAAQTYGLMGTTYNGIGDRTLRAASKGYMFFFNKLEAVSRAATSLAAYRLYRDRAIAAGADPAAFSNQDSQDYLDVMSHTETTLRFTLGDFALYNRPGLFRGPLGSIAYVYQQFKVTMVQLVRHLPRSEQIKLLALLVLLGGLKAIPFAEDLMDLIDTLAQKFKIPMGSVEAEIARLGDALMPGLGPVLLRGVLDLHTGATISSRIGMGDMIPFSGALLAGADPYQTVIDTIGPVASQIDSTAKFAGTVMDYFALGANGPLSDVLRQFPSAGTRALSDTLIFMSDGSISNAQGQLISENLPAHVLAFRLLGFFPSEATFHNDVVRMSRRTDNYAKEIRRHFVQQYAVAYRRNDTATMRRVVDRVNEWNESVRGTEFEIRDFLTSARRAGEAARQTTVARYHDASSLTVRPTVEQLSAAYGVD